VLGEVAAGHSHEWLCYGRQKQIPRPQKARARNDNG